MARARKPDPPPLATNDARTVTLGTAAWVVALLVVAALGDRVPDSGRWLATCGAGAALGVVGVVFLRRRARRP